MLRICLARTRVKSRTTCLVFRLDKKKSFKPFVIKRFFNSTPPPPITAAIETPPQLLDLDSPPSASEIFEEVKQRGFKPEDVPDNSVLTTYVKLTRIQNAMRKLEERRDLHNPQDDKIALAEEFLQLKKEVKEE